ncbi:MAG: cache domain-containing protein [Candidatus Eremiobacteraeota bacterium]|nr:cache domain-containing protein [Candidatus Eremiobacteraeota bacterium]
MKVTLMEKLIVSFIIVVSITSIVTIYIGRRLIIEKWIKQIQDNVITDLYFAREVYNNELHCINLTVRLAADQSFLKKRNKGKPGDYAALINGMKRIMKSESMDVLTLTDERGRVIARGRNPEVTGDDESGDEMVEYVLSTRKSVASTVIISRDELLKEGIDLAQRAHIKYIPTMKAKKTDKTEETSGMVLKAASPVFDDSGKLIGVIYGGNLLNRNFDIVDKVKNVVYKGMTHKGKDMGTVTIFQRDLRVSTNVRNEDGSRAIGTRVSEEVYDKVLVEGKRWTDKAFVVNNWYITAYEPIKDTITGEIIGILYGGVLADKFVEERQNTELMFLGIALTGVILAIIASYMLSRSISRPIKSLLIAARSMTRGELGIQVMPSGSKETQALTKAFNQMSLSLKESRDSLRRSTQEQLIRSEKLATIGQLAAGVAHEINNPLGSALLYSELILDELKEEPVNAENALENMEKLTRNVSRCKAIVKGLLDFARQTEPELVMADINEVLNKTFSLIEHQPIFHDVKVVKEFKASLPKIGIDRNQVQQVFTNIILNAAEAMAKGGILTVKSKLSQDGNSLEVEFTDTGCGIPEEIIKKVFDPFFTTKETGKGTGLGLSISYGIIQKHNGDIQVKSIPGEGTTFTVILPMEQ